VTDGTQATTANITLLGNYAAGQFSLGPDLHGGTVVTDPPVVTTELGAFAIVPAHQA
jgi:hypothetical protein